jgi:hypothetical protein
MIEGSLPNCRHLYGQKLNVTANGRLLGEFDVAFGDFKLTVPLPPELERQLLHLKIEASRYFMPGSFTLRGDRRCLAYLFKGIRFAKSSPQTGALAVPAAAAR